MATLETEVETARACLAEGEVVVTAQAAEVSVVVALGTLWAVARAAWVAARVARAATGLAGCKIHHRPWPGD